MWRKDMTKWDHEMAAPNDIFINVCSLKGQVKQSYDFENISADC
jgi:hypothetical protein